MKILQIFLCLVFASTLSAQADTERYYMYAEIVGTEKILSPKVNVVIDYGQDRNWLSDHTIVDKNGKTIRFSSMVDAMNHMSELGWEFVQAYAVQVTSEGPNAHHWLMKRACKKGKNGIFIPLTADEYRKSLESKN